MIHRTTITAESAAVLDASLALGAAAGAAGVLLLGVIVLLIVRAVRRRRAAPSRHTTVEEGYSAGVAQVPSPVGGRGRRAAARLFGLPERTIGLDVARGGALLMLVAVAWLESTAGGLELTRRLVTISGMQSDRDPAEWLAAVGAGVAIFFVLISGIASALTSGGASPVEGLERLRSRMRLGARAILLLGVGAVAASSGTPFAGLVATIGTLALIALPVLGWRSRRLFLAAAVWTVVVPVPAAALADAVQASGTLIAPPLEWALSGAFPPVPLVGVLLAGLAVGRLDFSRVGRRWIVCAAATGCALLAFGTGAVVSTRLGDSLPAALTAILSIDPRSAMPLALLGAASGALALVAVALIVGRALRWALVLVSAAGSMALTLWAVSLAVIGATWMLAPTVASKGPEALITALLGSDGSLGLFAALSEPFSATGVVAVLVVLVAAACAVWRLFLGDGPAERLVRAIGVTLTKVPDQPTPQPDVAPPASVSGFDALIGGQEAAPDSATGAALEDLPPDRRPVRRQPMGPVDPAAVATQWTPGQAIGRLPY
ncbi:hypothetical protein N1027_12970 [Herbiconiux sp. CPCC 205763]|uniref:Heparan-alpha-glucosaminide N-acetyltransferase catalytic domain-containing protein n=1 Tax=Herbiconiux aconitum TaxID=2970913 RepID=A0ABT2GS44_9MICO|nr:heparan-alpha-glucosaminide N-acetyltransferase domain-containing protein [Herbiconiux aconitum]MCS5719047.1 hypothetical protein [Herbiconiux aconitum]